MTFPRMTSQCNGPDHTNADELQGWVDGWKYRYRNEAVFKARVDTTVVGLMCALVKEME